MSKDQAWLDRRIGIRSIVVWACFGLILPGCGDDATVKPETFPGIVGKVVDASGAAVPQAGVLVSYFPDPLKPLSLAERNPAQHRDPASEEEHALWSPTPNPFQSITQFRFRLASDGEVVLDIRDRSGQPVKHLLAEAVSAGMHIVQWDGNDDDGSPVRNGAYRVRLTVGSADSDTVLESSVFLQRRDCQGFETTTDDAGAFRIPYQALPIGEEVVFTEAGSADPLFIRSVPSTIRLCPCVGEERIDLNNFANCIDVQLGELTDPVFVTLIRP